MSISSTLAAIEIGIILAAVSNGVLALQVSRYFRKPNRDPPFLRLLILVLWLATVTHLFLSGAILFDVTVTNHGSSISDMLLPTAYPPAAGLGAFIQSSVQSIYTYRLYKLRGHWLFPSICWTLSAYVFGSGITYSVVESGQAMAAVIFSTKWNWLFYSHFSTAAGVDILIASGTCWSLVQSRDHSLKKTRRLVNRIMLRIVQTGIATSVFAVCIVITLATTKLTSTWLGFYQLLTPLYTLTLLVLFNGRAQVKEPENHQPEVVTFSMESRIRFDEEADMNLKQVVHNSISK